MSDGKPLILSAHGNDRLTYEMQSDIAALFPDLPARLTAHKAAILRAIQHAGAELVARVCLMAEHWQYTDEDMRIALNGVVRDPQAWRDLVNADEAQP